MLPTRWIARLEELRTQFARRAALAIVGLTVVLVGNNVWALIRNQRELPPYRQFHLSPRDIEHEAREHQRYAVKEYMGVFYFLQQRIAGNKIVIPPSVASARWELEKVALLEVQVVDKALKISPAVAEALKQQPLETRPFRLGTKRKPWYCKLHLLKDRRIGEDGFVLVRHEMDLFVVSQRVLRRIARATKS